MEQGLEEEGCGIREREERGDAGPGAEEGGGGSRASCLSSRAGLPRGARRDSRQG